MGSVPGRRDLAQDQSCCACTLSSSHGGQVLLEAAWAIALLAMMLFLMIPRWERRVRHYTCLRAAFETGQRRLFDAQVRERWGVRIHVEEKGVRVQADCPLQREEVFLPWLEEASW